jgi:hypothetical protein
MIFFFFFYFFITRYIIDRLLLMLLAADAYADAVTPPPGYASPLFADYAIFITPDTPMPPMPRHDAASFS